MTEEESKSEQYSVSSLKSSPNLLAARAQAILLSMFGETNDIKSEFWNKEVSEMDFKILSRVVKY